MKNSITFFLMSLILLFNTNILFAAEGAVALIISPPYSETEVRNISLRALRGARIRGSYIVTEDTTPTGSTSGTEYCVGTSGSFLPFSAQRGWVPEYARLFREIDGKDTTKSLMGSVFSNNYSNYLGIERSFTYLIIDGLIIDGSKYDDGKIHEIRFYLQDVFGYMCSNAQSSGYKIAYGDILE